MEGVEDQLPLVHIKPLQYDCFPFPVRIILSHRMLSFIIWSCDQNFHYCDQLTEHVVLTTQNGDRERICCMFVNQADSQEYCQRKQTGVLLSWLFLRIHTAMYSQHVWIVMCSGACWYKLCTV